MNDTILKLTTMREEGWCIQIFIPSGKASKRNTVNIAYDNQGDIMRKSAPTFEQAIESVWAATRPE